MKKRKPVIKRAIFEKVEKSLRAAGFEIEQSDLERPWGGFFVIAESQSAAFAEKYFPGLPEADLIGGRKVSPKILIVAPEKRLSWQYHLRRAEVWRVLEGPVAVAKSDTDEQQTPRTYKPGEVIVLQCGERHRLIGLDNVGVVAEIWQHIEPAHPSDENDIVRLQDDFGR